MNSIREALQEYLDLRRSLGFKMHDAGLLLPRFVSFMETRHRSRSSDVLRAVTANGTACRRRKQGTTVA
ncbi:hypothetical protein OKW38_000037 [Paraburkholderia sp. MM5496-R1]